jgi:putative MATE family efflux protein
MAPPKQAPLTAGHLPRQLWRLTLPTIGGMFAITIFNITDTFFVSRLGTEALAAMGFTFPVIMCVGSFAMGISMGAGSVMARAVGRGDHHLMQRTATDGIILSVLMVAIVSVVGWFTIDPLFTLLGASPAELPLVRQYMRIWYAGVIAVIMPPVSDSCMRATGDMIRPLIVMIVCALINVILDPILIYGLFGCPKLGIAGAAYATVFSRIIAMITTLSFLHFHAHLLDLHKPKRHEVIASWKRILQMGIPNATTYLITPLTRGLLTRIAVTAGGTAGVAAFAAGTRIESFLFIIGIAISIALMPIVGQSWGAERYRRVNLARHYVNKIALRYGLVSWIVCLIVGKLAATLFSQEAQVIQWTALYLWIITFGHAGLHLCNWTSAQLNAIGKAKWATVVSLAGNLGLVVPIAYLGQYLHGYTGMLCGICAGQLLAGGVSAYLGKKLLRPTHMDKHELGA